MTDKDKIFTSEESFDLMDSSSVIFPKEIALPVALSLVIHILIFVLLRTSSYISDNKDYSDLRTNNSIQISILSLQEARIQPQPDNTGRSENQVESQFTEAPTLTEIEVRAPPPTDALNENIVAAEVGFPNDSTQSSPSTTKTEEAENESLPTVVSAVSAEDIRAIITSEGINCNRELPLNSVFSKCDKNHEQLDFSVIDSNVVVDFYRDPSASGNLTATG